MFRFFLAASAAIVLQSLLTAQTVFRDGGITTIDADTTLRDIVRIENQSTVILEGSIRVQGCNPEDVEPAMGCSEDLVVVEVGDTSHLELHGGVSGRNMATGVYLTDSATFDAVAGSVSVAFPSAGALAMSGESSANLRGASFRASGFDSSGGGISMRDNSFARMTAGQAQGDGSLTGTGVKLSDSARFQLWGGTVSGGVSDTSIGALLADSASLEIRGGSISAQIDAGTGLRATGQSAVSMSDGIISGAGTVRDSAAVETWGHARVVIAGGTLEQFSLNAAIGVAARDRSEVHLASLTTELRSESGENVDLVVADNAVITIAGGDFNFPMGVPITDTTGTITGKWAYGEPLSVTFRRSGNATIRLVDGVAGDYTADGMLTANDIDILSIGVRNHSDGQQFDLDEVSAGFRRLQRCCSFGQPVAKDPAGVERRRCRSAHHRAQSIVSVDAA